MAVVVQAGGGAEEGGAGGEESGDEHDRAIEHGDMCPDEGSSAGDASDDANLYDAGWAGFVFRVGLKF